MRVSDFDFDLPPERIALRPAEPRDASRLLIVDPRASPEFQDTVIRELPTVLRPGDALVFNDTKVIPARLEGLRFRPGGAGAGTSFEITLHRREAPDRWRGFARPARRLAAGDSVRFGDDLSASVLQRQEGEVLLAFGRSGPDLDRVIAAVGHIPLPPYIASKRDDDERDRADYQTMFAREEGAVAAPTAGLHFTKPLMEAMKAKGISLHFLTLHVGAGTFLPVKGEGLADHIMHPEYGHILAETADALNRVREEGGRIVAVGTTSLRLLESAAGKGGDILPFAGETSIFITPGYRFKTADALITNFHLPRSTLMMLVSAFAGYERMKRAYAHAIANGYRFYSYGDASLLFRKERHD